MTAAAPVRVTPAKLAIFLDFDGCLVDLAPRPQDVVVPRYLVPLLHRLWQRTGGAVALVSGRPVSELRGFLPGLTVPLCGSHGAERSLATRRVERVAIDRCALLRATRAAAEACDDIPGLLVERKPVGLGLHYRTAPSQADRVRALATRLVTELPGFHVHHGKMVAEIRPDHVGKGQAVQDLMGRPPFRHRIPVMFGDDTTDEPAFDAVNRFGGVSVKVGSGDTGARHRVADVARVRAHLAVWAKGQGGI